MKKSLFIGVLMLAVSASFAHNKNPLEGTLWRLTISGNTELLMEMHLKGNTFLLTSRKGSTKSLLGSKYFMARLSGKVNPTLVRVSGTCQMKSDTLLLQGKYVSLTSSQDFKGRIVNKQFEATLTNNVMTGAFVPQKKALADYQSIALQALEMTEENLYDPELLHSKQWNKFKDKIKDLSGKVLDDYEFEKGFNYQAKKLPFTHYSLSIKQAEKKAGSSASRTVPPAKFKIETIADETVLFTIKTFSASANEIQPFIDSLKTMSIRNLLIDLRNNGGGTIASALPLVSYLVNDTLYGGLFLTRKYFVSHNTLPKVAEFKSFPLFSEASFPLIIEGIHKYDGLCLVVYPERPSFKGSVYILTNRNTGSTCEPLVYGLKKYSKAIVVGERTAGAMLNGERFGLNEKYALWMPTADYYTADGKKLDKSGVEPTIATNPAAALEKVLELIK